MPHFATTCQIVILTIGIILLISLGSEISAFSNRTYQKSSVDGKLYQVISSFQGNAEAANTLAQINTFLLGVLKHMKMRYIDTHHESHQAEFTHRLLELYNPDVLREHNPKGKVNTSYVTNKGDEIAFCLREKSSGQNKLHALQTLKFVALHEMTHIMTTSYGHEDEFWENFKFLLSEAVDAGLYTPVDYARHPTIYCSLEINYCPLFDDTLRSPSHA